MAGTNDFLPFAYAPGANVLTQSAYAALGAVATGYQSGIAKSAELNKTWRQSSIMAAMVAQFIVDQTGENAVDDGTIMTLGADFIAALRLAGTAVGTDTGTANARVVNYTPAIPALINGMPLWFQSASANTGATTLNVNGLGVRPVLGLGQAALQGGEIIAGGKCLVVYSTASNSFMLVASTGAALQVAPGTRSAHAAQAAQVQNSAFAVANDTGAANACVVTYAPAPSALVDGMVLWFKAAAANTGATTINVNALGAKAIVGAANGALQGGEIVANGKCQVVWNATLNSFVLIGCTGAPTQTAAGTKPGHAVNLGQFDADVSPNGYQKLPSGLIVQWGVVMTSASADTTVVYPLAFPTAAYSVVGTVGAGTNQVMFTTNTTTTTSFLANAMSVGGRNNIACSWMAVGK